MITYITFHYITLHYITLLAFTKMESDDFYVGTVNRIY